MTRASLAALVRDLRQAGRIVDSPASVRQKPAVRIAPPASVPRSVELQCYRAVLARLIEIDGRIARPWPRAMLGRMGRGLRHLERRADKRRGLDLFYARMAERRARLDRIAERGYLTLGDYSR